MNLATERLIEGGESSSVQFVSSPNNLEQIAIAVCAFLNTNGGTVIAGLSDSSRQKECVTERSVSEIREYLYRKISPNSVMSVTLDETSHGDVVVVDVPNGRDTPYAYDGRIFTRSRAANKIADSQAVRQMVLEKGTDVQRWERRPSPTLSLEDLDQDLILTTIDIARKMRGLFFKNPEDHISVLQELELFEFGQLTNAADVVFGRSVYQRLPQVRVRAVRFLEDRGDEFIDDQLLEGPAPRLLNEILAFIRRHVSISRKFSQTDPIRSQQPQFPFESVTEGIVNALVHRDYSSFSGSVKVSIYPDRLEIWNSGKLPKGLTAKKLEMAKHDSILVNPDIGHIFYLNGLMERVGRGTFKIVRECRALGMRTPEWRNINQGVRLTFFSGAYDLRLDLNDRQIRFVEQTELGDEILTSNYNEMVAPEITARQARRDLEKLEDFGFIERKGTGRGTVFYRTSKTLD